MPREPKLGAIVKRLPTGRVPERHPIVGSSVTLEPLSPVDHAQDLFRLSHANDPQGRHWTYLPYGPFSDFESFEAWLIERAKSEDPLFFAFREHDSGQAIGMGSFMRMVPDMGVIEIGHLWVAPSFKKTRPATEALCLMMRHVFDELGYRRLEWKCNALNARSRRAAKRLGFRYEGTFRQHLIVKGRNRDSAWFSLLDSEWPAIRTAQDRWLAPENFDEAGRQKLSLGELTAAAKAT